MALTQTMLDTFSAMAGPDLSWAGVRGSSRPPAKDGVRVGLRADLLARQGGICPVCGDSGEARGAWEFNHAIARGPMVKGFVEGNIFAGHSSCNARTKPIYDNEGNLISGVERLPLSHFARPDVIPNEWTPFPVLRQAFRDSRKSS